MRQAWPSEEGRNANLPLRDEDEGLGNADGDLLVLGVSRGQGIKARWDGACLVLALEGDLIDFVDGIAQVG